MAEVDALRARGIVALGVAGESRSPAWRSTRSKLWLGPAVHHAGFFSSLLATQRRAVATADGEPAARGSRCICRVNTIGLLVLGGLVERTIGSRAHDLDRRSLGARRDAGGLRRGLRRDGRRVGHRRRLRGRDCCWLELRASGATAGAVADSRAASSSIALLPTRCCRSSCRSSPARRTSAASLPARGATAIVAATGALRREPRRARAARRSRARRLALAGVAARERRGSASAADAPGRATRSDSSTSTETPPLILNDAAWLIATGARADAQGARRRARTRATRRRRDRPRMDPNLLDTLAEVAVPAAATRTRAVDDDRRGDPARARRSRTSASRSAASPASARRRSPRAAGARAFLRSGARAASRCPMIASIASDPRRIPASRSSEPQSARRYGAISSHSCAITA